jgi:hypothetical protein
MSHPPVHISGTDVKAYNNSISGGGGGVPGTVRHQSGGKFAFAQMAAAILAATHFNERNSEVVPELADPLFRGCRYQIDFNNSRVVDSQVVGFHSGEMVLQDLLQSQRPCAMVGPIGDSVGKALSVLAASLRVPIVLYQTLDYELANAALYPYTMQTNALVFDLVFPVIQFLITKGRREYVSVLYELGGKVSNALHEGISRVLQSQQINTNSQGFIASGEFGLEGLDAAESSVTAALRRFKDAGNYRTIVVLLEGHYVDQTIEELARSAEIYDMSNGEHFWVFVGPDLLALAENTVVKNNTAIHKLLQGAAVINYVDGFAVDKETDPFLKSWRGQDETMVDLLKRLNPIAPDEGGFFDPGWDYFQTNDPTYGSSFLYDAVMSVGLGACLAEGSLGNSTGVLDGLAHVMGIQESRFAGASGRVEFGKSTVFGEGGVQDGHRNGVRQVASGLYGAFNLFPHGTEQPCVLTDLLDQTHYSRTAQVISNGTNGTAGWIEVVPFLFRNGSTAGPEPYRDPGESNYLDPTTRIIFLTLFSITAFLSIASAAWVFAYRDHTVVRASQPHCLLPICMGALLEATCIVLSSFDESYGVPVETLSNLCTAMPWCFVVGNDMIYCALFVKLWKVNKVLQFSRVTIQTWRILVPVIVLFVATIVLMICWTVFVDYSWVRTVTDEITGESYGACSGDGEFWGWMGAILVVIFIPIVLALVMAWKTKDVVDSYSESRWIFTLVLVQCQVRELWSNKKGCMLCCSSSLLSVLTTIILCIWFSVGPFSGCSGRRTATGGIDYRPIRWDDAPYMDSLNVLHRVDHLP